MNIGKLEYCLVVKDVVASKAFYEKLGFKVTGGNLDEKWIMMQNGTDILGLYQGHIPHNLLNFRRGDNIFEIEKDLKAKGIEFFKDAKLEDDGSVGAHLHDPDGNEIYLNTHPDEMK